MWSRKTIQHRYIRSIFFKMEIVSPAIHKWGTELHSDSSQWIIKLTPVGMLKSAEMLAGGGLSLFYEKDTVPFHAEDTISDMLFKVVTHGQIWYLERQQCNATPNETFIPATNVQD